MKKLLIIAFAAAMAGCATEKNSLDMRPEAAKGNVAPSAVVWQNQHTACLEAALTPAALAVFVESPKAADAILAKVQAAYKTEPMTAMQIGAITQMVMCPKCSKAPAARAIWKEALLQAAEKSTDSYRTMFFLDQLRWCGTIDQVGRINAVGGKGEKCVKDFAVMVNREIGGRL